MVAHTCCSWCCAGGGSCRVFCYCGRASCCCRRSGGGGSPGGGGSGTTCCFRGRSLPFAVGAAGVAGGATPPMAFEATAADGGVHGGCRHTD